MNRKSAMAPALAVLVTLIAGPSRADVAPEPLGYSPGFSVGYTEDRPIVETVEPDSPAARAGLKPGYYVLAIGDTDASTVASYALDRVLYGDEGSTVRVIVSDKHGAVKVLDLERTIAGW